ncbi:MAG: sigma 54-interacting transcriptional regulator [Blastocatellia bacterium]|nr:sigma 54-interacting transcriptional regulator [Blastocatellia bacterium]
MKTETLHPIATAIAQERSLANVLQRIVRGLADCHNVALARLWLTLPGDRCAHCPMRSQCPDQTKCLHLVASLETSIRSDEPRINLDDDFSRMPLNVRKIGQIAAKGEPLLLTDLTKDKQWIARPAWVTRERIQSFAGQPLIFRGEVLGVLAIFDREVIGSQAFQEMRLFADHAAIAIANARAFEEIERLRDQLELENAYLREEVTQELAFGDIVGNSAPLKAVLRQIQKVAPTEASVLIHGESGTGKELVARAIHERSQRHARPLIKVNCASVPRELFESEFFGHVKGSFTGAVRDRAGRFQLADGGTLFLDEIGEIPLELQSKLLRVLQEGEYERVGEEHTRKTNVRVIAATNRDLPREIAAGRFREDLYYRLNVFPLTVPPLRERQSDIPLLADHFLRRACQRLACTSAKLTRTNVEQLLQYDWPGNIRELQNVIERAVILSQGGALRFDTMLSRTTPHRAAPVVSEANREVLTRAQLKQRERDNILAALAQTNWKIYGTDGAAELLGLKATTLASRIKSLQIEKQSQ